MDALDTFDLPLGFGFHPTDVELISHYLRRKILGLKVEDGVIPEVDIYKHEPWDLPAQTRISSRDGKWHFFNARDKKYPNGSRSNRATEAGYWKSTGKDRNIRSHNRVIGTKKTLVFHKGRPPIGKRTDWIMHEYYLSESECKAVAPGFKDLFVLCRVTKRDGLLTESEELHTHIKGVPNPDVQIKQEVVSELDQIMKHPSHEQEIDAWVEELYDPNIHVVPAAIGCTLELEEVESSLLPNNEIENSLFHPNVDSLPLSGGELLYSQEHDVTLFEELNHWAYCVENANKQTLGEIDGIPFPNPCNPTFPLDLIDNHESRFIECVENAEWTTDSSVNGYPSKTSDTGIIIRESRVKSSDVALAHRIKLQIHKMESKNVEAVNHTVMLENRSHHLHLNELPQPVIPKRTATPIQAEVIIKNEIVTDKSSTGIYEEERTPRGNQSEDKGASSRLQFRATIRGLVCRALKEAHLLTRRYSPIHRNCILGTCLTGIAAFTG